MKYEIMLEGLTKKEEVEADTYQLYGVFVEFINNPPKDSDAAIERTESPRRVAIFRNDKIVWIREKAA